MMEFMGQVGKEIRSPENRMFFAQGDEKAEKTEKILVFFLQSPVNPGQWTVMAVSVVIPFLGPAELIACQNHGHAL